MEQDSRVLDLSDQPLFTNLRMRKLIILLDQIFAEQPLPYQHYGTDSPVILSPSSNQVTSSTVMSPNSMVGVTSSSSLTLPPTCLPPIEGPSRQFEIWLPYNTTTRKLDMTGFVKELLYQRSKLRLIRAQEEEIHNQGASNSGRSRHFSRERHAANRKIQNVFNKYDKSEFGRSQTLCVQAYDNQYAEFTTLGIAEIDEVFTLGENYLAQQIIVLRFFQLKDDALNKLEPSREAIASHSAAQQQIQNTHKPFSLHLQSPMKRPRLRTIRDALQKICEWRQLLDCYQGSMSLQEAAVVVGSSRRSLEQYLMLLRIAESCGFPFEERLDARLSQLRRFVRERGRGYPKVSGGQSSQEEE